MHIGTTTIPHKNNKVFLLFNDTIQQWELPGGKLDPGETLEECAKRELIEESKIDVDKVHFLGYVEHKCRYNPEKLWLNMVFITDRLTSDEARVAEVGDNEHSDGKWFDINDLPENIWDVAIQCLNKWR